MTGVLTAVALGGAPQAAIDGNRTRIINKNPISRGRSTAAPSARASSPDAPDWRLPAAGGTDIASLII
jgi:hypothetical protein